LYRRGFQAFQNIVIHVNHPGWDSRSILAGAVNANSVAGK